MSDTEQRNFQKFSPKFIGLSVVFVSIFVMVGLVDVLPLFMVDSTMTHKSQNVQQAQQRAGDTAPIVWQRKPGQTLDDWRPGDGVRPYKPLELAGRDIYIREGCYACHSQMVRPFRDEKERYGHYSVSSESMYDHPFQWGSKRTGPDLARIGNKYSDEWHKRHLKAPRSVTPESVMPGYPFLEDETIDAERLQKSMLAMRNMPSYPVPYTDEDIAGAPAAVADKTSMDALVAYLQGLGQHIKFTEGVNYRD